MKFKKKIDIFSSGEKEITKQPKIEFILREE